MALSRNEAHSRLRTAIDDLHLDDEISQLEAIARAPSVDLSGFKHRLEVLVDIINLVDELDPNTLEEKDIDRLWSRPRDAAKEAVLLGAYRERRILIEGRVAWSNWLLGVAAFVASFTLVAVEIWSTIL